MPTYKAIFIPEWMHKRKRLQKTNTTLYHRMLTFMHWRSVESIERDLMLFTPAQIVQDDLEHKFYQVKRKLKDRGIANSLVASVSMTQQLEQEIVVTIAPDVKHPSILGCIVLRLGGDGSIVDVVRDYLVNPTATATSKTNHDR